MNFVHLNKQPITQTLEPEYTVSSVIGMKYKDGVIIASDTLLLHGSTRKYMNVDDRIQELTPRTIIGFSGEYSDFQESFRELNELVLEDSLQGPSYLGPKELTHYLSSVHYYKRNQMDPYLNNVIIGGFDWDGELMLMNVDSFGTLLNANYFTTSYSHYFCNAIFASDYPEDYTTLTKEKAIEILKKCFEVLFYRQKTAGDTIVFKTLEKKGADIVCEGGKFKIESKWDYEGFKHSRGTFIAC